MKLFLVALAACWISTKYLSGHRIAQVLLAGFAILILLFYYPYSNNLAAGALEQLWANDQPCRERPPDTIIVLGGGVSPYRHNVAAWANFSRSSLVRVLESVELAKKYPGARLLFAGSNDEARLFRQGMMQTGLISESRLVVFPAANTTALAAAQIETGRGSDPDHAWLVTSALHMVRAKLAFERAGIAVCPYPVDFGALASPRPWWIIPPHQAIVRAERLLHEALGLAWYWLTDKI